ncbi:hypothetical protein MASR2M29_20130 [Spirochaetota bacterium]
MSIETVRVELLGLSFVIQTDESAEYVNSLISVLRSKIDAVSSGSGLSDPLKTAILAGIYLADELERTKQGQTGLPDSVDAGKVADRLIAKIDDSLKEQGA